MKPPVAPFPAHRLGGASRVIQGSFPGGQPRIPRPPASCAPSAITPPRPAPVAARPASVQPAAVPGRPGPIPLATRPGPAAGRPGPILPNAARPGAVQPAAPPGPMVPPIIPGAPRPTAVQPAGGNAFALPPGFQLRPSALGQRLPEAVQRKMESVFGASFADVRVHVGNEAASIGALAFTIGSDLYFAPGQYNPQTMHGQQLLGHELTHVIQQRGGRVRNPLGSGLAVVQDPALEAEAERMGIRAASSPHAIPSPSVSQPKAGPQSGGIGQLHGSRPPGFAPILPNIPSAVQSQVSPAPQGGAPAHAGGARTPLLPILPDQAIQPHRRRKGGHRHGRPRRQSGRRPMGRRDDALRAEALLKAKLDRVAATSTFELALIGAGSSIAYYLNSLESRTGRRILLIGEPDPWKSGGRRGPGYINHAWHVIAHHGDEPPEYGEADNLANRGDFARTNEAVFQRWGLALPDSEDDVPENGNLRLEERIVSIDKNDADVYEITTEKRRYFALKVVVGTGAGPHKAPPEAIRFQNDLSISTASSFSKRKDRHRVMDLDTFMRGEFGTHNGRGKSIVVLGPNAGIDATEEALSRGYRLYYLFGRPTMMPFFLETHHYQYEKETKEAIVRYKDGTLRIAAEHSGQFPLKVEFKDSNDRDREIRVHYFVYAVGQDINAPGAVGDFLKVKSRLVPTYDINQRFGEAHESVLGLRTPETDSTRGLELIGAAAFRLAVDLRTRHSYVAELQARIGQLERTAGFIHARPWSIRMIYDRLKRELPMFTVLGDEEAKRVGPEAAKLHRKTEDEKLEKYVNEVRGYREEFRGSSRLSPATAGCFNQLMNLLMQWAQAAHYFAFVARDAAGGMNRIPSKLTMGVIGYEQLGALRGATDSLNANIPEYVRANLGSGSSSIGVDFNSDDRTILRVYIARKYPNVSEPEAQGLIDEVIGGRRSTARPFGFNARNAQDFEDSLAVLNSTSGKGYTAVKWKSHVTRESTGSDVNRKLVGNCLYDAVRDAMGALGEPRPTVQDLRNRAAQVIRDDPARLWSRTVAQRVVRDLTTNQSWQNIAGDMAPELLAEALERTIIIRVAGRAPLRLIPPRATRPDLTIHYNGYNHYWYG